MRYTLLFSILLLIFSTSCNKQKFATTPSLRFESVNTTVLNNHQLLIFTLTFTDAQGDLTDSADIYVHEIVPGCPASEFEDSILLPSFPTSKDIKGNVIVTYGYNVSGYESVRPLCQQNDTAIFRFALKDNAKHVSDTISSPKIIVVY
jgi:hypothetical protein